MKTHYPLEHMTGVINNFGGFYRTEFYVHEARLLGAAVHAPDVNRSDCLAALQGNDLCLGLGQIAGLEDAIAAKIPEERQRNGPFASLEQFMRRVEIPVEQLRLLIRAGAFRFTGRTKKQLLWDIHIMAGAAKKTHTGKELFAPGPRKLSLPALVHTALDDAWDEIELLGFPLCPPFELLKDEALLPQHPLRANDLPRLRGQEAALAGYLVTTKPTRTRRGEAMAFGTFLDAAGHFFDTTHFPASAAQFPFRGRGCYLLKGRVDEEFGFYSLVVSEMRKLEMKGREDGPSEPPAGNGEEGGGASKPSASPAGDADEHPQEGR
jgi:DNA polymerase-3 subunit alpha